MPNLTIADVRTNLDKMAGDFARVLPPGMPPERFNRVVLTAIQNNSALLNADPDSLWNACMRAAQDGLLPDGREGAIVMRGKTATWMPMVWGIVAKAKRHGSVVNLAANIVYEGEHFEVLLGDDDRIVHRRDIMKVQRGKEIAVYAIATMKDGSKEREVLTWDQVQHIRKSSSTPNAGPWVQHSDEMARKSLIRRLAKRLPSLEDGDDELRQAIERVDELYPHGKPTPTASHNNNNSSKPPDPPTIDGTADDAPPPPPPPTSDEDGVVPPDPPPPSDDQRAAINASVPLNGNHKPPLGAAFEAWAKTLQADLDVAKMVSTADVNAIRMRDRVQSLMAAQHDGDVQMQRAKLVQAMLDAAHEHAFQTPAAGTIDDGWVDGADATDTIETVTPADRLRSG